MMPGAHSCDQLKMRPTNHDERRRRIAAVTVEVIARDGLEAATVRRIATELGGPTKIVTHYFSDKHELLVWTYRSLAPQRSVTTDFHSGAD